MSAQNKQEKKLMDERIAKVREVVRNFSTNDIVLALHHFELDVEKTIQAFVQGGHKEALGDWEQTGGSSAKKNNKKKSKSKTGGNSAPATSGKVTPASTGNGGGYNGSEFASSVSSSSNAANGTGAHKPDVVAKVNTSVKTTIPGANGLAHVNTNSVSVNGGGAGATAKPKSAKNKAKNSTGSTATDAVTVAPVSAEELARYQTLGDAEKLNLISTEATQVVNYASELNNLEKVFADEVSSSQTNVLQCFREIKQHLAERERQLCAELERCRDEAAITFSSRRSKLHELTKKLSGDVAKYAPKERDGLFSELKGFNANKLEDQQLAYVTRFIYNNAKVLDAVQHFGEVFPVKRSSTAKNGVAGAQTHLNGHTATENNHAVNGKENTGGQNGHSHLAQAANGGIQNGAVKQHSPSRSSIVSEESSDLSQISPVLHQKPAQKNVAQVATGGIVMQSDNLSVDQLADLQKRIEDTLRAQGIDPSVLSDLGVNTIAPRRRPPPGKNTGGEKRGGGGSGGGKNGGGAGNRKGNNNSNGAQQQQSKPDISILQ